MVCTRSSFLKNQEKKRGNTLRSTSITDSESLGNSDDRPSAIPPFNWKNTSWKNTSSTLESVAKPCDGLSMSLGNLDDRPSAIPPFNSKSTSATLESVPKPCDGLNMPWHSSIGSESSESLSDGSETLRTAGFPSGMKFANMIHDSSSRVSQPRERLQPVWTADDMNTTVASSEGIPDCIEVRNEQHDVFQDKAGGRKVTSEMMKDFLDVKKKKTEMKLELQKNEFELEKLRLKNDAELKKLRLKNDALELENEADYLKILMQECNK